MAKPMYVGYAEFSHPFWLPSACQHATTRGHIAASPYRGLSLAAAIESHGRYGISTTSQPVVTIPVSPGFALKLCAGQRYGHVNPIVATRSPGLKFQPMSEHS